MTFATEEGGARRATARIVREPDRCQLGAGSDIDALSVIWRVRVAAYSAKVHALVPYRSCNGEHYQFAWSRWTCLRKPVAFILSGHMASGMHAHWFKG